jgi:cellulose synthase/poly-beta-1,6-N-acetylglucosamine synthase-like glycosyltransferase
LAFGIAAQAVASLVVVLATWPLADYLRVLDAVLLALLVPALLLMAAILLAQAFEFAELFWEGSLRRRVEARPLGEGSPTPMVSVHLACCNEPAPMVLAAIQSLQALDWPSLELLIIDNNSDDPACWMPVQAYVEQQRALGDLRVRFIRLPRWPGYKAGALNEALRQTHPSAAWVAVVDADYVVDPQWLRRLGGWFTEPHVAVVQSPQAHRSWASTRLARMMNWEYEGFFRLGMHHRHERNAIVQHGTMTLIRAKALRDVGGWNMQCVCEDTELGLRLLEAGWHKVYVDEVLGTGLVPSGFEAYQRQRQRWARGGMQILRGHARALFGSSRLSLGQRYHFVAGWLPWIGDTLHLVFTLTALLWSAAVLMAPGEFSLPHPLLALPLVVFFAARLVMTPLLYHRRLPCSLLDVMGAAWAGMALSHRIARGVLAGLFGGTAAFEVTAKAVQGQAARRPAWRSVREEGSLLLAILAAAAGFTWTDHPMSPSLWAWWIILALQALPYAAAMACASMNKVDESGDLNTV